MSWFNKLAQKAREENERDYQHMKEEDERKRMREEEKAEKARAILEPLEVCANCHWFHYSYNAYSGYYEYRCTQHDITLFTLDEVKKEGKHWITTCPSFVKKI